MWVRVTGLRDFFPPDAVGGPRRKSANSHGFELILDGLGETVRTDIGSDAKSGKARGFPRCRGAIGKFFKHHDVKPGGYVELQRLAERKYPTQGITLWGSSLCVAGGSSRTSTF